MRTQKYTNRDESEGGHLRDVLDTAAMTSLLLACGKSCVRDERALQSVFSSGSPPHIWEPFPPRRTHFLWAPAEEEGSFCLTWRCFCKRSCWDQRKGEIEPVPGHEKSTSDLYGKTRRRCYF